MKIYAPRVFQRYAHVCSVVPSYKFVDLLMVLSMKTATAEKTVMYKCCQMVFKHAGLILFSFNSCRKEWQALQCWIPYAIVVALLFQWIIYGLCPREQDTTLVQNIGPFSIKIKNKIKIWIFFLKCLKKILWTMSD